jgi:hypothetical protein
MQALGSWMLWLILGLTSLQLTNAKPVTVDLALYYPATTASHVDDAYIVQLHANHTLEAHFEHIGLSTSLRIRERNFASLGIINAYAAQLNDTQVHDLIRRDPGVKYVRHQTMVVPPSYNITDDVQLYEAPKRRINRRWNMVPSAEELPYAVPMTSKRYNGPAPVKDFAVNTLTSLQYCLDSS